MFLLTETEEASQLLLGLGEANLELSTAPRWSMAERVVVRGGRDGLMRVMVGNANVEVSVVAVAVSKQTVSSNSHGGTASVGIGRSIAWRRSHWVVVPDVVSVGGVAMRFTRAEARRWFGVRPYGLALSVAVSSRGVIQGSHELVSVTINVVVRVLEGSISICCIQLGRILLTT